MERWEKYKKLFVKGEGAHGIVYKCEVSSGETKSRKRHRDEEKDQDTKTEDGKDKEKQQKRYVAIKKIRLRDSQVGLSSDAIREIKLLQELNHPNVMKVLEIFGSSGNINLVLEYMESDLEHIIKSNDIVLSVADIKQYMRMLLLAVEHCHNNWVLHRDIKPGNLLIGSDGEMKLADFGLAKFYGSPDRKLSTQACTLWYRAPELLYGAESYGTGADMWSVGCVFAELMLRRPFFTGDTELKQLTHIFAVLGTPKEIDWPGMTSLPRFVEFETVPISPLRTFFPAADKDALDLLSRLLVFSPSSRLTATQALKHPFFSSPPLPTPISKLPKPPPDPPRKNTTALA